MRRRDFSALLSSALALSANARAQGPSPPLRVGVVSAAVSQDASFWKAFARRLRELGHIEGRNFIFDFVNLQGRIDRYPLVS